LKYFIYTPKQQSFGAKYFKSLDFYIKQNSILQISAKSTNSPLNLCVSLKQSSFSKCSCMLKKFWVIIKDSLIFEISKITCRNFIWNMKNCHKTPFPRFKWWHTVFKTYSLRLAHLKWFWLNILLFPCVIQQKISICYSLWQFLYYKFHALYSFLFQNVKYRGLRGAQYNKRINDTSDFV
jgi:hypothetical protein